MLQTTNLVSPANMMGSLLYRSIALQPPTDFELGKLIRASQRRNRALGITGMLVYEEGHYLQSLEGPPDAMEEVWTSIRRDPRHCSIEVLKKTLIPGRMFAGWDMKLLRRTADEQMSRHNGLQAMSRLRSQVPDVTRLALEGDEDGLTLMMQDLVARGWPAELIIEGVLEPAARAMGDGWLNDDCTELDVTIGLGVLRLASRVLPRPENAPRYALPGEAKVLVVAAPGERHMLGTCLMADAFADAGWSTEFAFPESDSALVSECRSFQPAAIVIALSDAMPRTGALAALAETIAACRGACGGREVIVSVSGRSFAEDGASAGQVGADLARSSVAGMPASLAELIAVRSDPLLKHAGHRRDVH